MPPARAGHEIPITVWARFLVSLAAGSIIAWVLLAPAHLYVRLLLSWDLGISIFLVTLWPVLQRGDPRSEMPRRGRSAVRRASIILALASLASFLAIAIMLADVSTLPRAQRVALVALSTWAVVSTWALNNLAFAFRYAYEYLVGKQAHPDEPGAINFHSEPSSYWDFVYVAFEVGMTFGVTDTDLRSTTMRRLVLKHSVLSFWFNTVILALTLNLVASLL